MPITPLQQERLERALREHATVLDDKERRLSSTARRVHEVLIELGRNQDLLALIAEFVDSPTVSDGLRRDPDGEVAARGIELPEGVSVRVLPGGDANPNDILRFQVQVGNAVVLADWDPAVGPRVKLAYSADAPL